MTKSHDGTSIKRAPTTKLVLKETIGLITDNEDPVISNMRCRGWYLASRCTVHVCNSRDMFVDYQPLSCHEVILDNNDHVEVAGIGSVVLRLTTGKVLTLTNVFHIPTIRKCLVSIGKLVESGFSISLGEEIMIENSKSHGLVGKGYVEDGLFRLSLVEEVTGGI